MKSSEPKTLDLESHDGARERGRSTGCMVRPKGRFHFVVRLTDSDDAHLALLGREGDELVGMCGCRGFRYHGVCAHLVALERADELGVVELRSTSSVLSEPPECPQCGARVTLHDM